MSIDKSKLPSPAYPTNRQTECEGKTLRDSFAEHALQGLIAGGWGLNGLSSIAYELADDMLKERAKEGEKQ